MEKYVGIWMDGKEAFIINFEGDKTSTKRVKSKIHHHNVKGGSRTSTPYARQGSTSTRASLERKKHQQKAYFDEVKELVKDADGIYIFGPAETKILFNKTLQEDNQIAERILGVDRSDSMSESQMIAKAQSFLGPIFN